MDQEFEPKSSAETPAGRSDRASKCALYELTEDAVIFEPKSFERTLADLSYTMSTHTSHEVTDGEAIFLRDIRLEQAVEMLSEADKAHRQKQFDAAWYYLVDAAEAIGFLVASQGAVYPQGDEKNLRESIAINGGKGGVQKGVNAKALQGRIVTQLINATPGKGWQDRASLRREYNNITAAIDGYKDGDRKWRELLKLDDVKKLLPQQPKK